MALWSLGESRRWRAAQFGALLASVLLAISGCASGPIKTDETLSEVSVKEARSRMGEGDELRVSEPGLVLWGGVVLNTQNLVDSTRIEIMGYPLDRRQRPMTGRDAEGRFLVRYDGFLEPVDYAAGRTVTVMGSIDGVTTGTVGEAEYRYPTLQSRQIHLWTENEPSSRTGFTFGIGVNIGN
jgi:outer membrane lipoprotein